MDKEIQPQLFLDNSFQYKMLPPYKVLWVLSDCEMENTPEVLLARRQQTWL